MPPPPFPSDRGSPHPHPPREPRAPNVMSTSPPLSSLTPNGVGSEWRSARGDSEVVLDKGGEGGAGVLSRLHVLTY